MDIIQIQTIEFNKQNISCFYTHGTPKILIKLCDILYLQCEGNYTTIFFTDKRKIVERELLKNYELFLNLFGFIRINHNTLINGKYITDFCLKRGEEKLFLGKIELKISRNKAEDFKKSNLLVHIMTNIDNS